MRIPFEKILILSPHPDDAEIGCGGTIAKYQGNADVTNLVLSYSKLTGTMEEAEKANAILGMRFTWRNYGHRQLDKERQRILDDLMLIGNKIKPDVVFMPCLHDIHQDHKVVAEEGLRAFKGCTILGYEMPWNNVSFNTQMFVELNDGHVNQKCKAISKYQSQSDRPYASKDFITALAKTRGVQSGFQYAEAFEVIRCVLR